MKILITGSSGFLGNILYQDLKKDNIIYTLNRYSGDYNINLVNEVPNFNDKFDLVIHCAGMAHKFNEIDSTHYNTNVIGTKNLLCALENNIFLKQFIFISSVSVYGLNEGFLIDENHNLMAKDSYGLSKIEAEKAIINWCIKNKIYYTILMLPLIAGRNPPGNLGNMINFINKGLYFNIDNGNAKKSIVLGKDIAIHITNMIGKNGIYNLTDGDHPSFLELSKYISLSFKKNKLYNLSIPIAKILSKIGNIIGNRFPFNDRKLIQMTKTLTFSDNKARKEFGWNPTKAVGNFLN